MTLRNAFPRPLAALVAFLVCLSHSLAITHYVNLNNPTPAAPFTEWSTAAIRIQDAVDVATAGDEVLVTNGVYQAGARSVYGLTNRVAVTRAITVRSVNGPAVTQIVGYQMPGNTNGNAAVRCVYLTSGATLVGFTLTNGATYYGGTYNTNLSGGGVWCERLSAVVSNCVITGNCAYFYGGGAYGGTLNNCVVAGNSCRTYGGGAAYCNLNNCTVTNNSCFSEGGGTFYGTINNCMLSGNFTSSYGGGASSGTLNNCVITSNSASSYGGGASMATLNNCTLTGNSASFGGGVYGSTLNNCIVYYNTARVRGTNYEGGTFNYCCTTPLPPGHANMAEEPELASASHLSAGSPCRNRGSATYTRRQDIDGEPWANPPSVGSDEFWSGSVTGALGVAVMGVYTNVAVGFAMNLQARIEGRVSASRWDFGDGNVVSNRPWASHAWSAAGDYVVELRAYNESYTAGVAATITVRVDREEHFVSLTSTNPVPPYSSWATAAANIQDAVDAVALPGALVWVGDGAYTAGARAVYGNSNRVAVTTPVTVRSVNGPRVTHIVGSGLGGSMPVRCVYLTNGAVLSGFTLTNGATQNSGDSRNHSGGGVWCEGLSAMVSNCVLTGNSAYPYGGGVFQGALYDCVFTANSSLFGGAVYWGTLNNCVLAANSADTGGGAYESTLNNCTLTGNSADSGAGGAYRGTLNNCIVYYNTARFAVLDNWDTGTLSYCCTTPLPPGPGNLANEPSFVDTNGWTNLRLQTNSPCINSGNNAYAPSATDLDGNPRIAAATVDLGAYEFQSPASSISYAWLQQYGLPTDGSADSADNDLDAMNNWQEWIAGTNPTNAGSALRMLSLSDTGSGIAATWSSITNRSYSLERAGNLGTVPAFELVRSNIAGLVGSTIFIDTNASGPGPFFYRVRVEP